ncbi:MAG: glycogen/starch synthase, partial [Pseudomonadota bacterium]
MQKDNFEAKTFPNLSGLQSSSPAQPLRICIASQEILGPVRNGGIASTYYHLARGLVAQGHQVTIILLWGAKVQQYTTEYWQKHYADLGIDLQYLPWVDEPFDHVSHPWQGRCVSFCQWLE